jgi:ribosome maturation factor RimP
LKVLEEVRRLAGPLAEEAGFELVDVEQAALGNRMLIRVLLDKPDGITVGDCAQFSRRLSDCMDMNQIVTGSYQLEVSSPGIERRLPTLASIARFSGRKATVTILEPRDGRRNWEGTLIGPENDSIGLRIEDGSEQWFDWSEVKTARLVMTDPWARSERSGQRGGTA